MSESPMRLRNRSTPSKANDLSNLSYEELAKTPIRSNSHNGENVRALKTRQTRNSSRQLQLPEENGAASITGQDGNESTCSGESTNSNVENINVNAREDNERTPQLPNRLSRNRRKPSYVSESSINDEDKSIKCTIRRTLTSTSSPSSISRNRGLPLRVSVLKQASRASTQGYSDGSLSSSDDDDDDRQLTKPKRNASYFTKEDNDDYMPENYEDEEDCIQSCSEDEIDENQDDESSDGSESDNEEQTTPNKASLIRQDLTKVALTPEILNKLEGRSIRRHIGVNSPVATGSHTMSPNPETYFLAENRIKYKSTVKQPEVMNDAMKGKRRRKRKLVMGVESRLPEKMPTNFSVTTEAIKATVGPEDFISGNMHEEKVEQLFNNVLENEFPHWLGLFRNGFNVMLYGYGSKLSIFKEFENVVNDHYLTVTINGLFPKLVPRKLLYGIYEHVNPAEHIPHGTNIEAVAKDAAKVLTTVNHSDIFILINNFDNMVLRFPQMLTVLCWLSQVPYIHILASSDTVNAFLGVTQSQALQLNFCWMHCPTYKSYREELKWIPGIYGDETKVVTQKSSLKYVLQSLTGNARKAFALLAQMQLKQMKSRAVQKAKEAYAGVRFQELAKECREKFIAHSDENLRTLLVEFFDHKLIKQTGKGKHLENTLLIELDLETLEDIISEFT